MTIIEDLEKQNPKQDCVYTALEQLKNPEKIKQFFDEYTMYLKGLEDAGKLEASAEQVAYENVGMALAQLANPKITKRWSKAIPNMKPMYPSYHA